MAPIKYFQLKSSTTREAIWLVNNNSTNSSLREASRSPLINPKTGMKELIRCRLWTFKSKIIAKINDLCNRKAQDTQEVPTLFNPKGQTHLIAALLSILLISSAGETVEQPWWYATFQINILWTCYWSLLIATSQIITTSSTTLLTRTIGADLATPSSTSSTQFTLLNSISNIMGHDGIDLTVRRFVGLNTQRTKGSKPLLRKWSTWKTIKESRSNRWSCPRWCHHTLRLRGSGANCNSNLDTWLGNFEPILKIPRTCSTCSDRKSECRASSQVN